MNGIYKILKKILERLFGYKWICEHCGDIVRSHTRPFCKACCHNYQQNVKMFKIK